MGKEENRQKENHNEAVMVIKAGKCLKKHS